jgi:hypothetical protein
MKHVTCSRCHTVPTKRRRLFLTKDQERVCEDCLANQIAGMKWPRPAEFSKSRRNRFALRRAQALPNAKLESPLAEAGSEVSRSKRLKWEDPRLLRGGARL